MKRHSKNADSPVLNLPWPVCGKGRAAGLAGAGRAIPGLGSWTRPTLHRPRSEGVAPKFHVLREGTMARGSATSSGCQAGCGESKGKGVLRGVGSPHTVSSGRVCRQGSPATQDSCPKFNNP